MRRIGAVLICAALMCGVSCKKQDQPAETATGGNSTDRSANGTTGTGEPVPPGTGSAAAAQQLDTVAPSKAASNVAITGTADVHATKTETTSTLSGPNGTSTVAVSTPAGTSTGVTKKP